MSYRKLSIYNYSDQFFVSIGRRSTLIHLGRRRIQTGEMYGKDYIIFIVPKYHVITITLT